MLIVLLSLSTQAQEPIQEPIVNPNLTYIGHKCGQQEFSALDKILYGNLFAESVHDFIDIGSHRFPNLPYVMRIFHFQGTVDCKVGQPTMRIQAQCLSCLVFIKRELDQNLCPNKKNVTYTAQDCSIEYNFG